MSLYRRFSLGFASLISIGSQFLFSSQLFAGGGQPLLSCGTDIGDPVLDKVWLLKLDARELSPENALSALSFGLDGKFDILVKAKIQLTSFDSSLLAMVISPVDQTAAGKAEVIGFFANMPGASLECVKASKANSKASSRVTSTSSSVPMAPEAMTETTAAADTFTTQMVDCAVTGSTCDITVPIDIASALYDITISIDADGGAMLESTTYNYGSGSVIGSGPTVPELETLPIDQQ